MFKRVWAVFIIFLLLLMPVVSVAEAHEPRYIHITDVMMTFDGEGANITVEYRYHGIKPTLLQTT